ncbi:hypothetical protein [Miltoncostaea marina]|uniref:hypothetical protein n=1 Tax=Miltoncostaea marina TaxID=2843215 RepID=UPI001C3CD3CC|nr:hypothetical protein [Miltoncostaea marina]
MRTGGSGADERRLRAVGDPPAADREAITRAIEACAGRPAGVPVAGLRAAVAEHLAVAREAVPADAVTAALGLLIATNRVDESGGRLVAVPQEARRAG